MLIKWGEFSEFYINYMKVKETGYKKIVGWLDDNEIDDLGEGQYKPQSVVSKKVLFQKHLFKTKISVFYPKMLCVKHDFLIVFSPLFSEH